MICIIIAILFKLIRINEMYKIYMRDVYFFSQEYKLNLQVSVLCLQYLLYADGSNSFLMSSKIWYISLKKGQNFMLGCLSVIRVRLWIGY